MKIKDVLESDLVRRADVIDAVESTDWYHQNQNGDMVSGANSDEHQAWYKADDIYKVLEEIPSVAKRGKWIEHKHAEEYNGTLISNYECSVCHTWKRETSNYCPDCGRLMR